MEKRRNGMTTSKYEKLRVFFVVLVSVAFALFAAPESWAIPASPFPFLTTQPDGTTVKLFRRGDEFCNWVESVEGYTVLKNEDTGYWEFAVSDNGKFVSTGVAYSPVKTPPAGLKKHQKPEFNVAFRQALSVRSAGEVWTPRPISGEYKVLLIRVEFSD